MKNGQQCRMHMGVRADQRFFEGIRLIKAIGLALPVSDVPTSGLDDCHPSANIPLVAWVAGEHPGIASPRHRSPGRGPSSPSVEPPPPPPPPLLSARGDAMPECSLATHATSGIFALGWRSSRPLVGTSLTGRASPIALINPIPSKNRWSARTPMCMRRCWQFFRVRENPR